VQGVCSLEVLAVNITFDDGLWQCQVTSSSFQSQDALASQAARLVVREPPKSFSVMQNKNRIPANGQITVVDGQVETVRCESRLSNPPPIIRWFLDQRELTGESQQTNTTEEGDERRWRAVSALEHKFAKADYGKPLACRVQHPAYPGQGHQDVTVVLDVLCE